MALDSVKVLEIRLRLESPLILTRRRTATGFLSPLRYIPSTTLRGALVTALYREGYLDAAQLKKEKLSPEIVSSPAYPVSGGARTVPAHPFISKCKQCGEIVGEKSIRDLERRLVDGDGFGWSVECDKGHRALRPLHPNEFLTVVNGEFRADKKMLGEKREGSSADDDRGPRELYSVSVAISKSRASGVKGLLYHYEALSPGLEYWATVAVPGSIDFPRSKFVLHVGRGVSRGFGMVETWVVGGRSVKNMSNGCRVLYALSPTLDMSNPSQPSTFPRVIDLSRAAAKFGLMSNTVVRVVRVFGRMMWISLGWDLASGVPRPWVVGRAGGSLLVLERDCSDEALGALAYLGTVESVGEGFLPGFNMLVPLKELVHYAS